jgi:F0F1-type ATP synthase assembly protein I
MKISRRKKTQRYVQAVDLWSLLVLLVVVGAFVGSWIFLVILNALQD